MKEIKSLDKIFLEKYEVFVNPYLTYAQIQQIVETLKVNNSWAERQINIDMLLLFHATDIKQQQLEKYGHEYLLESGLIDAVKEQIINLHQLEDAIEWTEGSTNIQRTLGTLIMQLNQFGVQAIKDSFQLKARNKKI